MAGRIYDGQGNNVPALSCNGAYNNWYAETKYTHPPPTFTGVGSIIVNPGCTLYIFEDYDFAGNYSELTGPSTYLNPKKEPPLDHCSTPCAASLLWTCKQIYPSCTPTDKWQPVTQIDNSLSSVSTTFTYEKTVGKMRVRHSVTAEMSGI